MEQIVEYRNQDGARIIQSANAAQSYSQLVYYVGCPETGGVKSINHCTMCSRNLGFSRDGVKCSSELTYKPLTRHEVETREVKLKITWK